MKFVALLFLIHNFYQPPIQAQYCVNAQAGILCVSQINLDRRAYPNFRSATMRIQTMTYRVANSQCTEFAGISHVTSYNIPLEGIRADSVYKYQINKCSNCGCDCLPDQQYVDVFISFEIQTRDSLYTEYLALGVNHCKAACTECQ